MTSILTTASPEDAAEEDAALLRALGASDERASEAALIEILRRHNDAVLAAAARLTDPDTADDIRQQIFTSLWDRRASLPEITSLRGYLLTAVRHRAQQLTRNARNTQHRLDTLSITQQRAVDNDAVPQLLLLDVRRVIHSVYMRLSPDEQAIFSFWYDQGRSREEIASLVGTSPITVYRRLVAICSTIKAILIAEEFVPPNYTRQLLHQCGMSEELNNV